MTAARRTNKNAKFEDAIQDLESIIERIETGEDGLEQSLVSYEHGVKLIEHCRAILDTAEKKITELTTDQKGKLAIPDDDTHPGGQDPPAPPGWDPSDDA